MHPLETATPERQRHNPDFTESKASFVVYEIKKTVKRECRSEEVFFTQLKYLHDPVQAFLLLLLK